jgi:hypothetical protein
MIFFEKARKKSLMSALHDHECMSVCGSVKDRDPAIREASMACMDDQRMEACDVQRLHCTRAQMWAIFVADLIHARTA